LSKCAPDTQEAAIRMQRHSGSLHPGPDRLRILDQMGTETDRSTDGEVAALLDACAHQDRDAFQRLYAQTAPQLLACLIRILRQRALAEDALQDVFVQVWKRAGQYEAGRGSAWGWLIAIARYRAIDLKRREGRQPAGSVDGLAEIPAEDEAFEASSLGFGEQATRLLVHCLGALQPRQRDCIVLAYHGGLSHAEVATEIGEPLGSVKSWIRRGLAALKKCLES
jgi:RNA polymerase sigma-70 factor (ECF subfamily)